MPTYEKETRVKDLNILAPEQEYVERMPGSGPSIAWKLDKPGEQLPEELTDELTRRATSGQRILLDTSYVMDGQECGRLFEAAPGDANLVNLRFVDYRTTKGQVELLDYNDSFSLDLRRYQTDELIRRMLDWASSVTIGEETNLPHERVEIASISDPAIVTELRVGIDEPSATPNATSVEEYHLASLHTAIAEQLAASVVLPDEPETVAKRSLLRRIFSRQK